MKYISIFLLMLLSEVALAQTVDKLLNKGNFYYQGGQYDAAEQQYRKALAADPTNETAQYNLANALQKQKRYDEAIQVLGQLAQHTNKPNLKSAAFYNQGVAYTKQKDLQNSIEAYKNALRLNPADQEARENLELAFRELKKQQQQNKNQQQKQQSKMSQKEADQKLQLLSQREKQLQQRLQNQSRQSGSGQTLDW
jgi:Ca-activated chloride channel homolog